MEPTKSDANEPDRGSSAARLPLWACVLLVLALSATRLIHLGADTPADFVRASYGIYVDEGYKTTAARNRVLFGSSRWNPADDSQDWSEISPLTTVLFEAAFRRLGVEIRSVRAVTVVWFGALLLAAALALRDRYGGPLLCALLCAMTFEAQMVAFSRTALLVVPLMLFATLPQLVLARKRFRGLLSFGAVAATCLVVATIGVKIQAPAYAVGALVAFGLWWWFKDRRDRRLGLALVALGVAGGAIVAYSARELISYRIISSPWDLRLATLNSMHLPSAFALAATFLAAGHLVLTDRTIFRDAYVCALLGTIVIGPFAIGLFSYDPVRYYAPLFPTFLLLLAEWTSREPWKKELSVPHWSLGFGAALLLAQGVLSLLQGLNLQLLERLPLNLGRDPGLSDESALLAFGTAALLVGFLALRRLTWTGAWLPRLVVASLVGTLLVSAYFASRVFLFPSYASTELAQRLEELVEPEATVGGDWAPFLFLGTDRRALHMSDYLNELERLGELDLDYYLHSDTELVGQPLWERLQTEDLGVELSEPLLVGSYVGREVRLHRLEYVD
ncbi:MAG: hypothetical protein AAF690_12795 [Acidobacteriota bacterium]